jgi:hypothetical protein
LKWRAMSDIALAREIHETSNYLHVLKGERLRRASVARKNQVPDVPAPAKQHGVSRAVAAKKKSSKADEVPVEVAD